MKESQSVSTCTLCLGLGNDPDEFLPDDYVCPYIQQKCNFHDLTIAELEEAYEIFDAIPEETRNRLIDEIFKKNKITKLS